MPKWFFSLQFRLIAGFFVILVMALGSVNAYIGYTAQREAEKIERRFDLARNSRILRTLSRFYWNNGSWVGIQPVIERAALLSDRSITVTDEEGKVVGATHQTNHATRSEKRSERGSLPIMVLRNRVGSVRITPNNMRQSLPQPFRGTGTPGSPELLRQLRDPQFIESADAIKRSLIWAGAAAALTGLILVSVVSRRFLRSVRALTRAADALGRGDLSQRVNSQGRDDMGELGRTFNSMANRLQDSERQRRNMVSDVAHELRTPLSNVQGYTEAIRDGLLEANTANLETMNQQVQSLSILIDDLQLLADAESKDFRLSLELNSMGEVVRVATEAVRPRAKAQEIDLHLEFACDLPHLNLDRVRMKQVIGILLENALSHTPPAGRIKISVWTKDNDEKMAVAVADDGDGISSELLPYVFERFYRVDPSRSRTTGGAGLGLTIAKHLVEAHGGSIRAESKLGVGSKFVLEIPLKVARDTQEDF